MTRRERMLFRIFAGLLIGFFLALLPVGVYLAFQGRLIDAAVLAVLSIPCAVLGWYTFGRLPKEGVSKSSPPKVHRGLRFAYLGYGAFLAYIWVGIVRDSREIGIKLTILSLLIVGIPAVAILGIGLFAKSDRFTQ